MEKVGMYGKWREKIFLEPECEGIPVYAALSLCNVEMCHFVTHRRLVGRMLAP